jgi:hypothetical protein
VNLELPCGALALVLVLGTVACSTTETSDGAPDSDAPPGSGAGPGSETSSPPAAGDRPWRPSSVRIELTTFSFWTGSSGYAKDRADMTAAQLAALEGLRTIPTPELLGFDASSWQIRIVDADGSVAAYRAAFANIRDSDESAEALKLPTIDVETLEPFLATLHCLHAKKVPSIPRSEDAPLDPSTADTSKTTKLPVDTGCINGVFLPQGCADAVLGFEIPAPATYELSTGRCIERLSLRLYASDRSTLLAEGTPGTGDTCTTLQHGFEPGSYVAVLGKTNAAGCQPGASGVAGDTSLSLRVVK